MRLLNRFLGRNRLAETAQPEPAATASHGIHGDRLHGLDAVRGVALLLGVILHASMSYLPGSQYFWLTSDSDQSIGAGLIFFVTHNFRMLTFFLLAGFFAHMQFHRLGLKGFAKDRWQRIGKVLLLGWPLLFVALVCVLAWSAALKNGGELPKDPPPGPAFTPDDFPLMHLWFLYVLALLYVLSAALRGVIAKLDSQGRIRAIVDALVRLVMYWWAPLLLAVPVALSLYSLPEWYKWFGVPTPDRSLYPNLAAWTTFGLAFGWGWLLHRQLHVLKQLEQRWFYHLALALSATIACLYQAGLSPELVPASKDNTTLAYAFCYSVAAWSWAFALLGLGLRFGAGYSATRRYLADASYWIYLIHLPVVFALQVVATLINWPWWLELSLSLGVGLSLMLLSYHYLVRYGAIGAMLNGTRRSRPNTSAAIATTPATVTSGEQS